MNCAPTITYKAATAVFWGSTISQGRSKIWNKYKKKPSHPSSTFPGHIPTLVPAGKRRFVGFGIQFEPAKIASSTTNFWVPPAERTLLSKNWRERVFHAMPLCRKRCRLRKPKGWQVGPRHWRAIKLWCNLIKGLSSEWSGGIVCAEKRPKENFISLKCYFAVHFPFDAALLACGPVEGSFRLCENVIIFLSKPEI